MVFRLVVFDVDGTLVEGNEPAQAEVAERLKRLERRGVMLALASGKPLSYLLGFARGIGIKISFVIAENGCVIFDTAKREERRLAERPNEMSKVKDKVLKRFGRSIWMQPNQVELTFFPKDRKLSKELASFVKDAAEPFRRNIVLLEHKDVVDVLPMGIDKGKALLHVMRILKIKKEEVAAVGDSSNDLPMFSHAGLSLLVGRKPVKYEGVKRFDTITEALDFLAAVTKNKAPSRGSVKSSVDW